MQAPEEPRSSTQPGASTRFYGRRKGRPLRPGRIRLLDELLPTLAIPRPAPGDVVDPSTLFDPLPASVRLEIGFGAGEHLLAQAVANPEIGYIGCEPFVNGVAALLSGIAEARCRNVRILADDARPLLDALVPSSIDRVYLLFPDPWPKTRHHHRRIVSETSVAALARALRDGGQFRFVSDDRPYVRWTLGCVLDNDAFQWTARAPADWRAPPPDATPTRYEKKAQAVGVEPVYLAFERLPRPESAATSRKNLVPRQSRDIYDDRER